ncbi:MAG: hypothetical protein IKT04_02690 [Clostridia bacterium]|nr:hypothetical protein [Clostridia bacterium]MBR6479390.1 hypothetical protein [Clostridia bacterium]MBR6512512.1 hypothetical protein [Clostridia bacterium]
MDIKEKYVESVDDEVLSFVYDVASGGDSHCVTVGFVNEEMATQIETLTGLSLGCNRILLTSDAVKHIIKRHGENGQADHSMADYKDIARICYVLNNYDEIFYTGEKSYSLLTKDGERAPHIVISKKIDGFYYVIEAVSDGKKKQNNVVTAFRTNKI